MEVVQKGFFDITEEVLNKIGVVKEFFLYKRCVVQKGSSVNSDCTKSGCTNAKLCKWCCSEYLTLDQSAELII